MRTRILHVIKTLELGGAETNLLNLVRAFDPERYEHHIAYSFGGALEESFRKCPGLFLYRYSRGKHRNSSPHTVLIVVRLWAYLRHHRIRLVHTHNFNAHFWGVFAAKAAGAKIVEHVHDFRYFEPEELVRRKGDMGLNRHIGVFKGLSDRVVVLTEQNREFLIRNRFYPESRVRIIPNGIPLPEGTVETKAEVAEELGYAPGSPVVLVTSRMTPTKNIDLVLRIAPQVVKEVPAALFLIAGDGERLETYKREASATAASKNIRFIGYRADVQRLLAASDVFWLPSFLELHSISILEALSLGVPVVASKGVGCNDQMFISGRDAFLHDPFSDDGWAGTLVSLLKDGALRRDIGSRGRALCRERYDIRRTASCFEKLYAEMLP
jgi:glycosyltransferase involved in cell wall biosynthesis